MCLATGWLTDNRDKLFAHCLALYKDGRRGLLAEFPAEAQEIREHLSHLSKRRSYDLDWALRAASRATSENRGLSFNDIRDRIASLEGRKVLLPDNMTLSVALQDGGWTKTQRRRDPNDPKKKLPSLWYPPEKPDKPEEKDQPLVFTDPCLLYTSPSPRD